MDFAIDKKSWIFCRIKCFLNRNMWQFPLIAQNNLCWLITLSSFTAKTITLESMPNYI